MRPDESPITQAEYALGEQFTARMEALATASLREHRKMLEESGNRAAVQFTKTGSVKEKELFMQYEAMVAQVDNAIRTVTNARANTDELMRARVKKP